MGSYFIRKILQKNKKSHTYKIINNKVFIVIHKNISQVGHIL